MSGTHPRFFWYELQTRDLDAAQAFYGAVVGWGMSDAAQPGMRYTILSAGSRGVGGMMTLPAEGAPAAWLGYVVQLHRGIYEAAQRERVQARGQQGRR